MASHFFSSSLLASCQIFETVHLASRYPLDHNLLIHSFYFD